MRERIPDHDPAVEELLAGAADALSAGDPATALDAAERACALAPRSVAALHFRAAALVESGQLARARQAYEQALALDDDDPETLLGAADLLVSHLGDEHENLDQGLQLARRGGRVARRAGEEELAAELSLVEGMALSQLGDSRAALAALDAALAILADDPEARLERGIVLFELLRLKEAEEELARVVERDPDEAWAHHYLGLLAERRGQERAAEKHLARARRLLPEDFPPPVALSAEAFDRAVEDALAQLPEKVSRYLTNVAITVEDIPADDDLTGSEPPLSPTILGVFRGSPWRDKGTFDPWAHFPSSIVLYQRNLERCAENEDDLIEQIGITLIHEVGHFLGLDEHELRDRGLD